MSDTIYREAVIEALWFEPSYTDSLNVLTEARDRIKALPSAQSEIIHCKDCKHKGTKNCVANAWATIFGVTVKDDFYCGLAERRTDETD